MTSSCVVVFSTGIVFSGSYSVVSEGSEAGGEVGFIDYGGPHFRLFVFPVIQRSSTG